MRTLALTLAAALLAAGASAQTPPERRPSIRTTGEATVAAQPDHAVIDIGVIAQASSAQAAAAQNAQKLDAAMRELKAAVGAGAEIKTVGYSLEPDYRYPKEGGQPTIAGYTARNVVEVTTGDLAAVGKIIDAATASGANTIQSLQFLLKNDQAARAEALQEATVRARAGAEAIASALGVKILGVLAAEEGAEQRVRPTPMPMARMAAMTAPTPVAPGAIDIQATVTLTVEISR
jgi:uncharacterized protein YggE